VVVFGRGIAAGVADKITITDSTGKTYGFTARPFYSEANAVAIRPTEDWAVNETITITVAAGVQTVDGFAYDAPFSFSFTTQPVSGPRDPTTDPTPHAGEPWTAPPEESGGGGCDVGGGAGLGVALVLLARRRRRQKEGQS
jgi:MYXO-CTERM domain-containing protein